MKECPNSSYDVGATQRRQKRMPGPHFLPVRIAPCPQSPMEKRRQTALFSSSYPPRTSPCCQPCFVGPPASPLSCFCSMLFSTLGDLRPVFAFPSCSSPHLSPSPFPGEALLTSLRHPCNTFSQPLPLSLKSPQQSPCFMFIGI